MIGTKRSYSLLLAILSAAAIAGCGEKQPAKSGDWTDNLKAANPDAEPDLSGADEDPEPAPKADPVEAPKPDTKAQPQSGRPLIQYGPKSKIESTFGATPGSKLQLTGDITLVIPEFALDAGYNIVFEVNGKHKQGAVVGGVARLKVNPGDKLESRKVKSRRDPFQIRIGTGGAETINLAVGVVETDPQGNEKGKPSWSVIAPKRVDKATSIAPDGAESASYSAVFELESIGPVLYFHGTTDAAK